MTFRNLTLTSSLICFVLTGIWVLAPQHLLAIWGVDFSQSTGLVAIRGAALFLGLGVMLYRVQLFTASPTRNALVSGFVAACAALAFLGIFEISKSHAGSGIVLAILVETVLAIAFLSVERIDVRS